MQIINHPLRGIGDGLKTIPLRVDRVTLAKRRWRGSAEDGCEFGFDLAVKLFEENGNAS